jgi:hypothetical protein
MNEDLFIRHYMFGGSVVRRLRKSAPDVHPYRKGCFQQPNSPRVSTRSTRLPEAAALGDARTSGLYQRSAPETEGQDKPQCFFREL